VGRQNRLASGRQNGPAGGHAKEVSCWAGSEALSAAGMKVR
jgi:hypothetical protein